MDPCCESYLSYKLDRPETIRDQAKMNLASHHVQRPETIIQALLSTDRVYRGYYSHGRAEKQNCSSSVDKYFTSERSEQEKYFFIMRREISYLQVAM